MIIINTVSTERFSVDGIEYFKNFTPVVAGDTVRFLNTYDSCIEIVKSTNYVNITLDGVVYGSVALLQSALLPVIYTRDSLGNGISPSITTNVSVTYAIDWNAASNWNLTMTANTIFSEINLPPMGVEKTITVYIYGNFSPTDIVAWGIIGDAYDGVNGSLIVVQWKGDGTYHAVRSNLV